MTYSTIDNVTNATLEGILQYPTANTPIFYSVILFTLFTVITLSSFFKEMDREGKANFLSSLAVASFVTQAVAITMTLLNLIQLEVMVLTLVIGFVFEMIFFFTRRTGQ